MFQNIAICSTGSSPSSLVDERFGRCACFMIWNQEKKEYVILSNSAMEAAHGAGTGAVQSLLQSKVGIVPAQRVGPKAFAALEQAGIKIISGIAGKTVEKAFYSYEGGELPEMQAPND